MTNVFYVTTGRPTVRTNLCLPQAAIMKLFNSRIEPSSSYPKQNRTETHDATGRRDATKKHGKQLNKEILLCFTIPSDKLFVCTVDCTDHYTQIQDTCVHQDIFILIPRKLKGINHDD